MIDLRGRGQAEGKQQNKTTVSGEQNKCLHLEGRAELLLLLHGTQNKVAVLGSLSQGHGRGDGGERTMVDENKIYQVIDVIYHPRTRGHRGQLGSNTGEKG